MGCGSARARGPSPATELGAAFLLQRADRAASANSTAPRSRPGGRDNGAPGLRADYGPNYYAAFVVDPDGYRLEAYCGAEA